MIEVPTYPIGAPQPCVISLQVIGDGNSILGEFFVEIPINVDRGNWRSLRIDGRLATPCGTAVVAELFERGEITHRARTEIINQIQELGAPSVAADLLRMGVSK